MAKITVLHQGKKLEEHEIPIALTEAKQGLVTALRKHLGNVHATVISYGSTHLRNLILLQLSADDRTGIEIRDGRPAKPVTAIWFRGTERTDKQMVAHTPAELVRLIRPEVEPLLPPTALGRVLALFRRPGNRSK